MRERAMVLALVMAAWAPAAVRAQDGDESPAPAAEGEETAAQGEETAAELEAPTVSDSDAQEGDAGAEEDGDVAEEADVPDAPMPRQALSLHLLGLLSGGLAIQYERFPGAMRDWSFAVSLGSRLPASGDYASVSLGVGGEVRWWAFNFESGPWDERADGGFFLGGRLDVGWYHVWDTVNDRAVGDTLALTPSVLVGWRFDVARTVEITPTVGIGVRNEIDPSGRLAAYSRGTVTLGLTVGWMR